MVRRTKEEAIETRNRILDTAEHIFHENGVSRTSLEHIARAAGVTRGAIYWHFKNKADLFTVMFDRIRLPMETMIERCRDNDPDNDPVGTLRKIFTLVLRETARNPQRRRVLEILFHKCEYTDEMGSVIERHQEACADGRERIEHSLRSAVALGQLPVDLDTRRAAVLLHAMITGLMGDWLFMPESFDLEANAAIMVDSFFDMLRLSSTLRTPPGA
ncbi:TetR family transcriptional regulator [Paralcaligenes sp. KSB-10]|uniref:TetR family transcriptional regulator n=1 Tax=Paralcaligenes sp. KSB-10 TaxID=2901142 RepID=UPI001E51E5EC|nr:TetR family transcriptional regulator [Paralcaligenes sp. KSB-10]UHL66000.1 TetR family transcriptional regulator [Paralcaligenes sp. KSB-10]